MWIISKIIKGIKKIIQWHQFRHLSQPIKRIILDYQYYPDSWKLYLVSWQCWNIEKKDSVCFEVDINRINMSSPAHKISFLRPRYSQVGGFTLNKYDKAALIDMFYKLRNKKESSEETAFGREINNLLDY